MSANTAPLMAAIANCGGAVKDRSDDNNDSLARLSGPVGSNFKYIQGRPNSPIIPVEQMPPVSFANSDADLDQAKNAAEDFREVFNTWSRFSHKVDSPQPALPEELNTWELMPDNSIQSTINSTTVIGFVSPTKFKDYSFIADVSSTANDDDYIGLVAAAVEIDGRLHTLSAIRSGGGNRLWQLVYNFGQTGGRSLMGGSFGMEFPDGIIDDTRRATGNNDFGSWRDVPYGARIRVERQGRYIRCYTTNYFRTENSNIIYHAPATGVIDLDSNPDFAKFKDGASIGYICSSQANSTWKVIERPKEPRDIVDARDGMVWRWNITTNTWELMGPLNTLPSFAKDSFYYSPVNDQIWFVDRSGLYRRLR